MFSEEVVKNTQEPGYSYNVFWFENICFQTVIKTNERRIALERGRAIFAASLNGKLNERITPCDPRLNY